MKVSVVIAVLDSHEIVRRQVEYFKRMDLPDDIEFIFLDDGSEPSIEVQSNLRNFKLLATHDRRRWTQGLARMRGIKESRGEYIFCTDIDHIISKEALDYSRTFCGDKAVFRRRFAYLDEDANLIRDKEKVVAWGLNPSVIRDSNLSDGVHGNTWLIRKKIFEELGGYNQQRCESGTHLQGEDRDFNSRWMKACKNKKYAEQVEGPPIYVFPMGKYHIEGCENPHGLFHKLYKEKWGDVLPKEEFKCPLAKFCSFNK